jgi:glycosyltransferase involved in cell wall biosynthesis
VAILLPKIWRGGMLRNARALADLIARHEWDGIGEVSVVLGLRHDGQYDWAALRAAAHASAGRVSIREMEWTSWPTDTARRMFPSLAPIPSAVKEVVMPRDYRHNFLDCDAWIIFGQSTEGYIAPLRRYAVYCADIIQRYVPEVLDRADGEEQPGIWDLQIWTFLGWRAARCVFSTTPQTAGDVVGYAGVPSARSLLTPTLIEPLIGQKPAVQSVQDQPYLLWVTSPAPHKNHPVGVRAARIYYKELGGTLPLVIVGVGSELLNPQSTSDALAARAFREAPEVLSRTHFSGEVSDAAYVRLVGGAAAVWHNVISDNGSFVAFDAARANRHLVSSDYPQIRYLCNRYGVAPIWHPPDNPSAAAQALNLAESRFRAGNAPLHSLRMDAEEDRIGAYGAVLRRLLEPIDE